MTTWLWSRESKSMVFFLTLGRFAILFMLLIPTRSKATEALSPLFTEEEVSQLARDPRWTRALYFRPTWFGGVESLVDDPDFFLSPKGKADPLAELRASLQQLESENRGEDLTRGESKQKPDNESFQCMFPLRTVLMDEKLDAFRRLGLQKKSCTRLSEWRKGLPIDKVSLLFSSYAPDNPGSMFGHTLLRLHSQKTDIKRSGLLDFAVNFAAVAETKNPIEYVVGGLGGNFPGKFGLMPFYIKFEEYTAKETRALWQYELKLSQVEVERVLLSLWEVGPRRIDYYYFDDNCSYIMLFLLENASPRIQLTKRFRSWVIPGDTVRAVADHPDLVRSRLYIPSLLGEFLLRESQLSKEERDQLTQLLASARDPAETEKQLKALSDVSDKKSKARVLDAALDFVDWKEKLAGTQEPVKYTSLRKALLSSRSKLDTAATQLTAEVPEREAPENAHLPSLVSAGVRSDRKKSSLVLRWRPALNDLESAGLGHSRGHEVHFFDTRLEVQRAGGKAGARLQLDHFELLGVRSRSAWLPYTFPFAWDLTMSVTQDKRGSQNWKEKGAFGGEHKAFGKGLGGFNLLKEGTLAELSFAALTGLEGGVWWQRTTAYIDPILALEFSASPGSAQNETAFPMWKRFRINLNGEYRLLEKARSAQLRNRYSVSWSPARDWEILALAETKHYFEQGLRAAAHTPKAKSASRFSLEIARFF